MKTLFVISIMLI